MTTRYALKVVLIYLSIRCVSPLVLILLGVLPPESITYLVDNYGALLRYTYPVMPVRILNVPPAFQDALALLPVLIIECLLVFLLSAWFLRSKPWAAHSTNKSRWVFLVLGTVVWSHALRNEFLFYIQNLFAADLSTIQDQPNWMDELPYMLLDLHWRFAAILYVTAPLWVWFPVWLHFRFAKRSADVAVNTDTDNEPRTVGMAIPLQRATVFASFMLACFALHITLTYVVYMGLWPWTVEQSQTYIPQDVFDEIGQVAAFGQIGVSALICALAAYFYVRRLTFGQVAVRSLIVKALYTGVAAYVLTCFLFLAISWFVAWVFPQDIPQLMLELSYAPESGIIFVIVFNIVALVLLCLISGWYRDYPRFLTAVLGSLVVLAAVPAYLGWVLVNTNMGLAGVKPGMAVTGELGDARWRNTQQWCTGVIETRHDTWLIGRTESTIESASYLPPDVPDLSKLVSDAEDSGQRGGLGLFGSRPLLTTLSRLQDDGTFNVVAVIPEVACMVVTPDTDTLFLFTGLKRHTSISTSGGGQTVVFRSTDHGHSWEWLESGFMPETQQLAWSLKPTFFSDTDVWAWGTEPPGEENTGYTWQRSAAAPARRAADGSEIKPTALFYSADQGQTTTVIYSPAPLVVPPSYLRELTDEPTARFSSSRSTDQKRFVVQVDDTRAYAWVAESTWYHVGDQSHRIRLTSRAELMRSAPDGEWQITRVIREPDVVIRHVSTSSDGRTYAILQDQDKEWLVRLDPQNGEWIEHQNIPSLMPRWLAQDDTSTRYFWSNGDYQVVSKWGRTVVPRILIPFSDERAEISTDAHFYTRDGGQSWHQLAIPDYLGVMGLSAHGSKLYWSKGDWYLNDEPLQWHYDLAK